MLEYCSGCEKKHDDFRWLRTEEGWFCTTWYKPSGKSDEQLLEKFATPFWKHFGLTPTREELAYDRELKRKGKTYYEAQRDRMAKLNQEHDSTELKKKALNGELKQKNVKSYKKG